MHTFGYDNAYVYSIEQTLHYTKRTKNDHHAHVQQYLQHATDQLIAVGLFILLPIDFV